MKVNQISYVVLQATSQFSFKFCITLQCHDTWFLWNFLAKTYALVKKSPWKYNFSDFWVLLWKFAQFLMSFLKQQGQGLIKFCITVQCHKISSLSIFSAQTLHTSVSREITLLYFLSWNFIWFGQKGQNLQNFRLLTAHVKFHHIL